MAELSPFELFVASDPNVQAARDRWPWHVDEFTELPWPPERSAEVVMVGRANVWNVG